VRPAAQVLHVLPGRVRIGVPSRRRDTEWIESARRRLESCDGVEMVSGNPTTGTLLIFHRLTTDELRDRAESADLFDLREQAPTSGKASVRLSRAVRSAIDRVDGRLEHATRGDVDVAAITFLVLAGATAYQMMRGKVFPAAVTLLNYAVQVLPGLSAADGGE
jgi:hypothetical protein